MDADIYSQQFHTSLTTNLNCSMCSRFVDIRGKMFLLHKPELSAQLDYEEYSIDRSYGRGYAIVRSTTYEVHL